jgi:hypothetical protein
VTCINISETRSSRDCPLVFFGLRNGSLGAIEATKDEAIVLWENEPEGSTASITVIKSAIF